jgi:phosphoadenosine phosphosulfate reductase
MKDIDSIQNLNEQFKDSDPQKVLEYFISNYKKEIAFASSMGAEDQIITHFLSQIDKSVRIFTLDTGRLFPETYSLISRTKSHFEINIEIFFPDTANIEKMVNSKGINLFYESIENRKLCCNIRKIEPLKRAFKGLKVWICGLRREQAVTRQNMQMVEWDNENQLIKINPLINWKEDDIWNFINKQGIPYNKLHDNGFPSIGCQPCTRSISKEEDVRAGRWWWENPETKECGLHAKK